MRPATARAALVLAAALAATPGRAAAPDEYRAAYAAAEAQAERAAANKNQWPATTTALTAAKAAADAGEYGEATGLARQAEALARASIDQTEREATAWKDAEIR